MDYKKSFRYRVYRFAWVSFNNLARRAGNRMVSIAKAYDK